jgi:hypothetical protein
MQLNKITVDDIKPKSKQLALGMISMLAGAILIPYVFQISYAQSVSGSPPSLKFFRTKVDLDKSVIPRGQEQTIEFSVEDSKSHQPVGGAITHATVTYPAGTPVRQFSGLTDSSGHSTISWKIERNAPLDTYDVGYKVELEGYVSEDFSTNFAVIAHGVNNNNNHNDHHHNDHHHNDHDDDK